MRASLAKMAAIALSMSIAACASIPRPTVLEDLDRVHEGSAAAEAKRYAPDAFARAEKLRGEAQAAFDGGDLAGSQLLAERAIAAFAHAAALARIARADAAATEAKAALATADAELAALDADQQRVRADAEALELKVKVARDAQPIQPSGRADPERERARLAAARALATEARMLCGAAKLLAGSDDKHKVQLDEAESALAKVETELGAAQVPAAPIDGATRARANCLGALTAIRRAASPTSRASGAGDALLAAISATKNFTPARDDRGVVVALRGAFAGAGTALSPQAEARLVELGKIAAANASFPIEIVIHSDRPVAKRDEDAAKARGEAAVKAIEKGGGKPRTLVVVAGDQAPIADPKGPDRARNARVEIVFVTPETF